jgi:hypothetical protein
MYYCHFSGYLRGAVQGHHASTNFPDSTTPHIAPSQQEVARRQVMPHATYVCVCVTTSSMILETEGSARGKGYSLFGYLILNN